MKFKLEIELGNDAMKDSFDLSQVIEDLLYDMTETDSVELEPTSRKSIMDLNGDKVGYWEIVE